VTCQHGHRRVVRREHDGSTTVLADAYNGRQLNSPNDVVAHSDGSVWFTDPSYGIMSDYEGHRGQEAIGSRNVYRWSPDADEHDAADARSGADLPQSTQSTDARPTDARPTDARLTVATNALTQPNGLAFSPDESLLYVSDSEHGSITVFDVDEGKLAGGRLFASSDVVYDGLRIDTEGRVWAAATDGIHVYDPDGTLLGVLGLPEIVANLEFGGPQRNLLYITATTRLYVIRLTVQGAKRL
jgi:gluconolactonase